MQTTAFTSRRLLFFTLYFTYIAVGIIGILPGPTLPLLASHTGIALDAAGWIFTGAAFGFACGVMLAGMLSRRFAPKYIVMSGLFLMGLTALITPITHSFPVLLTTQFVAGVGFGFLDVSINLLVTYSFHDTLGETLNNLHSSYCIGALLGPLLLSLVLTVLHNATWAYVIGTFIAIGCILSLVRQQPPTTIPDRARASSQTSPTYSQSILRQPLLWFMALQFFFYVAAEVGFSSWIVTAISQSAVISLAVAAPVATAFWTGQTAGRLLGAQIIKRGIFTEQRLVYLCIFGGGLSGLLIASFPSQLIISFIGSAIFGLCTGPLFPSLMAIASRWFVHALGAVSSVLLICCGLSGMIFPAFMGMLIPTLGISWVIAIPALACLGVAPPFWLALRKQQHTLQLQDQEHTIEEQHRLTNTLQ
ncbi:MAG TPA: MFS transporter [Ktedonobacteraceae bacterium]|jgi:fucose permease|nr:MFS transporter [Ktedonobacteraceae bacterium]